MGTKLAVRIAELLRDSPASAKLAVALFAPSRRWLSAATGFWTTGSNVTTATSLGVVDAKSLLAMTAKGTSVALLSALRALSVAMEHSTQESNVIMETNSAALSTVKPMLGTIALLLWDPLRFVACVGMGWSNLEKSATTKMALGAQRTAKSMLGTPAEDSFPLSAIEIIRSVETD